MLQARLPNTFPATRKRIQCAQKFSSAKINAIPPTHNRYAASSSRVCALLTITIRNALLPYADEGQVVLVD
ncbi:hypothetical protein B0H17DRAFT_1204609 [Mycena rosella]|uniref:Uncharacterized protein n=1 Tax=Mycena rosella TaxID=1033263 RepID=A0AAD7D8S6_MYCRO|nr:hypothetical protein B0H17DRAFT_1204609 [Mycena rosella]